MLTRLDLSSARWSLRDLTADTPPIRATTPGCVHTALLTAGLLPNLDAPDAEKTTAWVGEHDWLYRAEFDTPADLLAHEHLDLVADGLDCLATLRLNGHELGRAANAFRTWRFPASASVSTALRPTGNVLEIELASPVRAIATRAATPVERDGVRVETFISRHAWLRRMACNHGWDWGPAFPSLGLGPLHLEAWSTARLASVHVTQLHAPDGKVTLSLAPDLAPRSSPSAPKPNVTYWVTLSDSAGLVICAGPDLTIPILAPQLWWPNGLGAQPLYTLAVELRDTDDRVLDTWTRRIGLRTIRLVQDPDPAGLGRSFGFDVNGLPLFAKGANWIPADLFPHRVTPERLRALLAAASGANLNMLRVWGGGIYEADTFYELCDELGLLVWQDFMFACARYPAWDDAFLADVRAEAADQIRRLRHHACLALWCGNNEIEHNFVGEKWAHEKRLWTDQVMSRADYDRLFRATLGETARALDPATAYISASPHDPIDPTRWPGDTCGDNHYWDAWFWGLPFASQRSSRHRFVSEFGFQSLPSPELLARLGANLEAPPSSPANAALLAHHQRCHGGDALLARYATRECGSPGDTLRAYALRTQLVQALALQSAIEHWRASFGRTRGALIWQLNDIWPALSWSLLDSDQHPKLALGFVRRAFAPLLLAAFEDRAAGTVRLVAVNDHPEPRRLTLRWSIRASADGRVLEQRAEPAFTLAPHGACFDLGTVELLHHANREGGPARVFLVAALHPADDSSDHKTPAAEAFALLASPGEFAAALGPATALHGALANIVTALRAR